VVQYYRDGFGELEYELAKDLPRIPGYQSGLVAGLK